VFRWGSAYLDGERSGENYAIVEMGILIQSLLWLVVNLSANVCAGQLLAVYCPSATAAVTPTAMCVDL